MNELKQIPDKLFFDKLRAEADRDQIQKIVMGGVIINNGKVLLLERPADDFMGGIHELPSGKLEEGESLKAGLIREIKEETGLDVNQVLRYLGSFDYLSGSGKKCRQYNFLVSVKNTEKIVLTEHSSYLWVEKENIKKSKVTDSVKEILSKMNLWTRN
jgi:8-oxo-dGTP diphosphatase